MGTRDTLLAVQEHDLAIDRLAYRRDNLAERAAIVDLMSELVGARLAEGIARIRRDELTDRQARLEGDTVVLAGRIADIERRLYGGTVSASRELSAMAAECSSLRRQLGEVEDHLLAALEESEPIDAELGEMAEVTAAMEAEQERLAGVMSTAELVIEAEIEVERASRSDLAVSLPAPLMERYERLRLHLGGIGAAKLANGSCGGCHLALPAAERARLHHLPADEVTTCDQCGRILVP